MSVCKCLIDVKLSARLPLQWQWLSCLLRTDCWPWLLFPRVWGSLRHRRKPVLRVALPGTAVLFFALPSWRILLETSVLIVWQRLPRKLWGNTSHHQWVVPVQALSCFERLLLLFVSCYLLLHWRSKPAFWTNLWNVFFSLHSSAALRLLGKWPIISVLPCYLYYLTS